MGQERLQKVLAQRGVASRRTAEAMIAQGAVTVNGMPAVVGQSVDVESDVITVNGEPLLPASHHRYLALHKPAGYVTSLRSTHGEKTVMELVSVKDRVYPVGRLDRDTSGLLLLTNDGAWANMVTHPSFEVDKEYTVTVQGRPSEEVLHQLRQGVLLPSGDRTSPARVELIRQFEGKAEVSVTVVEGKKRQIRLMMAAVGHPVTSLRRDRVGSIRLGSMGEGQCRDLLPEEVEGIGRNQPDAAPRTGTAAVSSRRDRWAGGSRKDHHRTRPRR